MEVVRKLRTKKSKPGQPKRMTILRKIKHIRRWILRNPWVRPMCAFNYAAILIQKCIRGFIIRRRITGGNLFKKMNKARTRNLANMNKQLTKYLKYMDTLRNPSNQHNTPSWVNGGFSSWCVVKIQSMWRMRKSRNRFRRLKFIVNQVAAIVIQTSWKNLFYSKRLARFRETTPTVSLERMTLFDKRAHACHVIQLKWRSYCNRKIYRYFRDLIMTKLKNIPIDFLRSIFPNEAELCERAAGVHMRFRLGGRMFPPKIYFKIFTHRPLCDVNAFAPRDYTQEVHPSAVVFNNKSAYTWCQKKVALRVGVKYFDAVVNTTSKNGTANWYKREERNNWRPLASHSFGGILRYYGESEDKLPLWLRDEQQISSKSKPFHFSRQVRKQDLLKMKKLRKRQWMMKLYLFSNWENEQSPKRNISKSDSAMDFGIVSPQTKIREILSPNKISREAVTDSLHKETTNRHGNNSDEQGRHLIDWSLMLNFDEYVNDWTLLGCSAVSESFVVK